MSKISRRVVVLGMPAALAGCVSTPRPNIASNARPPRPGQPPAIGEVPIFTQSFSEMYGTLPDGDITIPPAPLSRIDPQFLRSVVDYRGPEAPGTIVVDPKARYLYLVHQNGRAIRYGVGVGREGFGWAGEAVVKSKQVWPKWFPPAEMRERQPELQKYAEGMPGGLGNPLGARAHYLWQGNHDTYYRIHGSSEPWTIGHAVSSGCIRMINHDVVDLYNRVPEGTQVVVRPGAAPNGIEAIFG